MKQVDKELSNYRLVGLLQGFCYPARQRKVEHYVYSDFRQRSCAVKRQGKMSSCFETVSARKFGIVVLFVAIVLSVLMAANMSAFAIVAYPEPRPFEQPDGDTIQVVVKGDEYLNWTEDADGNLIVYDKAMEGYCFAIWGNRGVMSTGVYVTAGGPGGVDGMEGPDGTVGAMSLARWEKGGDIPQWILEDADRARSESTRSALQSSAGLQGFAAQAEIDSPSPRVSDLADLHRKTLIIHATWEDRSGFADVNKLTGRQIYNSIFNPGYRSANSYYKELIGVSGDALSPAHVNEPMDGQQGVIEVVLDGKHTDPDRDSDEDPLSLLSTRRDLMRSIINEASESGLVDFSRFDENGNGIIESTELVVGIFVDGFDRSVGVSRGRPSVWAGADFDTIELINTDDKKLSGYFFMGSFFEIDNRNYQMGIGTICHEYGHIAYGFDDLYDYGSLTGLGMQSRMGYWSLMDQGAYGRASDLDPIGSSPSYVDAYNLVRHGIVTPGVLVSGESVTVAAHNQIYIAKSEVSDSQYFLVQQRKYGSTSNYDRGSFYNPIYFGTNLNAIGGILICQIDENVKSERINDKPTHMRASIVEAHGQTQHLRQIRNPTPWDIPNLGDREDLWGVDFKLLDHSSDPSSNFYSPFTYDLVLPTQNISSGISISGIKWDSSTGKTAFTTNIVDTRYFIESFTIPGQMGRTVIDHDAGTIKVYMPIDTNLRNLVPHIQSVGAKGLEPPSGSARNFESPQTYRVTAVSGDYKDYIVTVAWSAATDGLDFSEIYQPVSGTDLSNSLGSYIYFGNYTDEADGSSKPRLWYVAGEEDGVLVLVQRGVHEKQAFSPLSEGYPTGNGSYIYRWLNNTGLLGAPFTRFFKNGELAAISRTEVNTIGYDIEAKKWAQISDQGSSNTMFYLMNASNLEQRERDSLPNHQSSVSWSATLDGVEKKLIDGSRIVHTGEYWSRSMQTQKQYYTDKNAYAVWNNGISGSSIAPRSMDSELGVRPVFQLDINSILFISEIGGFEVSSADVGISRGISSDGNSANSSGGSGADSVAGSGVDSGSGISRGISSASGSNSGYIAGVGGDRNYKLTIIGSNDGSDVGSLDLDPDKGPIDGETITIFEGEDYVLTGFDVSASGEGYTLNYKIVQRTGTERRIIKYGSTTNLSEITFDTGGLTSGGAYTLYVWLQRNNEVHSHEATVPKSFRIDVRSGTDMKNYLKSFTLTDTQRNVVYPRTPQESLISGRVYNMQLHFADIDTQNRLSASTKYVYQLPRRITLIGDLGGYIPCMGINLAIMYRIDQNSNLLEITLSRAYREANALADFTLGLMFRLDATNQITFFHVDGNITIPVVTVQEPDPIPIPIPIPIPGPGPGSGPGSGPGPSPPWIPEVAGDDDESVNFDINGDGVVDLADVAAVAYFLMMHEGSVGWDEPYTFTDERTGMQITITPSQLDVNGDKVIDIVDIVMIMLNFD